MAEQGDSGRRPALRVVAGGAEERPAAGRAKLSPRGEPAPARDQETPRIRPVDEGLVAAFLVGDDEAFGELFRRHERLVLAIVRRYARTPEDAQDLAERAFLRAFEAARRSLRRGAREGIPFQRWLVRAALALARSHDGEGNRFTRTSLDNLDPADVLALEPAAALARAGRAARTRRAVLRLPRRQREVLTLRLDAELPFAEIAAALELPEEAARVSFHRAVKALAADLEAGARR